MKYTWMYFKEINVYQLQMVLLVTQHLGETIHEHMSLVM